MVQSKPSWVEESTQRVSHWRQDDNIVPIRSGRFSENIAIQFIDKGQPPGAVQGKEEALIGFTRWPEGKVHQGSALSSSMCQRSRSHLHLAGLEGNFKLLHPDLCSLLVTYCFPVHRNHAAGQCKGLCKE